MHEAYARLVEGDVRFESRAHFFALAARTMRRVLVDHARAKGRGKRGSGSPHLTLTDGAGVSDPASFDLLALDEALTRLVEVDDRKAKVVELHFFGGLTYPEISTALSISEATVDRDLRVAKAWLAERLA